MAEATATRSPRSLSRWPVVLLLAVTAAHMLVFDRGMGGDGWGTFALTESLALDRDVRLENNVRAVRNGLIELPNGRVVTQYPPGVAFADVAPFWLGRLADRLLPAGVLADADLPPLGAVPRADLLAVGAIVLTRNLAVLVGLLLAAQALLEAGLRPGAASLALACVVLGGPLAFYALVGMTHAPAFALAAWLMLLLVRQNEDETRGRWWLIGGVLGAALLVRYDAVALGVPVLAAAAGPGAWSRLLRIAAGPVVALALLAGFWRWHHGAWFALAYGGDFSLARLSPFNLLFAPQHGALFFHPVLVLAVLGLLIIVFTSSGQRRMAGIALGWALAVALLHGFWSDWANPGGWGQRFLIDALPPLALGLAPLLGSRLWLVRAAPVAAAGFGYLLFLAAVGGLASVPVGHPWPQTLADYRPVVAQPPDLAGVRAALDRASFLF